MRLAEEQLYRKRHSRRKPVSQSHGPKRRSRRTAAGCQMQITPPFFAPYRQKKEDFFMSEKKVGKRLLTWVLVLVMTLSLLPLNVLAANPAVMRIVRPDTDKYITYNFYLNEGDKTPYYSQIIKNNESLDAPATPEKKDYKFVGWYDGDEQFSNFGTAITVTEGSTDVDLYAKFVPVCYVYFMDGTGEGARIIATKEVTATDPLNDFSDVAFPIGADEAITGWVDKDNNPVTSVSFSDGTTYLYPVVEKGHWIEFNSNGGSYVAPQFVTDTTKEPTPPTKPGYDFVGWYTNEETNNEFEFGNILSNNLTLYAKWTPNNRVSYTVIHWWENANDDGYSFHERETKYGKVGDPTNAAAKTYSITDKSLTGQSITRKNVFSPQAIEQQTIKNDGSTIVNIYYKRAEYKLSFGYYQWKVLWTEWKEIASITKKYGENISSSEWPKNGNQANWEIDNSEKYIAYLSTMPLDGGRLTRTSDEGGENTATYYVETLNGSESGAICVDNRWFIVHHYDKTKGTSGNTVGPEDRYAITGFEPISNLGTQVGQKYKNAKFYYSRSSYDIVYVNTGAKDNDKHTVSYKFEASITDAGNYEPTTPPAGKEGYVFAGWYADPAGEQAYDFTGKTMPAQNITVYAKWEAPTFTVTVYDVNKETKLKTFENVSLRDTIDKDAMPTDKVTLAEGDTFLGWTYEDGTPFNFNTAITQDIELYARVGNKTGYSVTYVVDSSIANPQTKDTQKYAKDSKATVLNNLDQLPANKVFLYWEDASGNKYYPNSSIKITGNVTLYAVYGDKAETVTVTYHSNFGSTDSTYTTKAMPNNGKFSVADYSALDLPDRTGYEFTGWSTKSGEQKVEFEKGDDARADTNGSNDLYAQWKPIQITDVITVTIKGNTSTVTYDGQPHTVNGYDIVSITGNADYTQADVSLKSEAQNKYNITQTNAGTYTMALDARDFVNTNDKFTNVKFVIAEVGQLKLTINKRNVTLTSASDSKVYDGTALTKPEVTVTGDGFVTGEATNIKATGSVTNVSDGEVTNTITYNEGANFKADNYEITTTEGKLTITKRSVTLTSETANKVYDGTPLTKPEVTVTGDGFVTGEVTDIKATGTITDVGTVTNTITFAKGEKFKDSNYAITKTEGTLEVTPITDKVTVTITGNTKTVRYNGKEQSVTGFTYTAPEGVTVAPKDSSKAVAKGTNVGTYKMGLTSKDFTVTSDIYKEFKIIVNDGYLEITRSGGHHPRPKPTVEIEDDDALGLNTTDHFAYIVGYGNGEVRPQNNITRAEVATIFFRLLTDDVRDENLTKTNRYSDVTRADWYNTAVSTLSSMGIITGYPDGTFRPNAAITRAEFAAIAARFDNDGDKTAAKFSDIATHWAKDEISIAYNNGWITGYPDGTFGPQRDITRAETMTLVNRVLNRQPETEEDLLPNMTVWTDNANPKAWYYLAVQEATNSHYYKFKTNSKYEKWTELRETRDWTQLEK